MYFCNEYLLRPLLFSKQLDIFRVCAKKGRIFCNFSRLAFPVHISRVTRLLEGSKTRRLVKRSFFQRSTHTHVPSFPISLIFSRETFSRLIARYRLDPQLLSDPSSVASARCARTPARKESVVGRRDDPTVAEDRDSK